MLVRPVAGFRHQRLGRGAARGHIGAIAGQGGQHILRHAPDALRLRQQRAAHIGFTFKQNVDERLAVDGQRHRPAQIRVIKRRLVAVHDQVQPDIGRRGHANRFRRLLQDVAPNGLGHLGWHGHVHLAGHEGQHGGGAIGDDGEFNRIEIRFARAPVILITGQLDVFVLLEFDKLERPGADRRGAHFRSGDVARINRRVAGGEHRQQRRLRPIQLEGHFQIAVRHHRLHVVVPGFARVLAELVRQLALQQIDGAFHVIGGERLAVMPFHAGMQLEGQGFAAIAPGPAIRQFRPDRVRAVLGDVLIEDHQIVENAHERHVVGERRFLMD